MSVRPDWISYRASIARVDRRLAAHEAVPTCEHCECETDVQPVPHSPRCPAVTGEAVETHEEEAMPDTDPGRAALAAMDSGDPQVPHQQKEPAMSPVARPRTRAEILAAFTRFRDEHKRLPLPSDAAQAVYLPSRDFRHSTSESGFESWQAIWDHFDAGPLPMGRAAEKYRRTGVVTSRAAKAQKASPPRVAPRPAPPAAKAPEQPAPAAANGSVVSKAERVLACARAVDEFQAQLEQARAEFKEATEALL